MRMQALKSKAIETAVFLRARLGPLPRIGLLTGTGLGQAAQALAVTAACDYSEIPHFPLATVPGHAGRLLAGEIRGCRLLVLQGRFHLYEGYSPAEVTFPVRVMQELGVQRLIVTNAAGGLDPNFQPGDMMLIRDHINLTGENPLIGLQGNGWGRLFPDMTSAYDPDLMAWAEQAARTAGLPIRKGVYAGLKGPSLETPAETRFLKTIGADAVGFSTVQEVIAAVHAGIKILGISIITNVNDPDYPLPATLEDIVAVAHRASSKLGTLLSGVLDRLHASDPG
jgi:purine-nucleoside phosphorylase